MRKILATVLIASLLSAVSVAPAFAHKIHYPKGVVVLNPLLPVAAAVAFPAVIVANAAVPVPVGYGYAAPVAYSAPYYLPGPHYRGYRVYGRGW